MWRKACIQNFSIPASSHREKRAYCNDVIIADRFFSLKLFLQIIFCRQITSFWLMYSSNSRRLTSFFVPTNKTKGQLGERSILSILLMPMLLYSAASLAVSVILRWMGTVRMLSMEMSPFVVLNQRTHFPVLSEKFFRSEERGLRFCSKRSFHYSTGKMNRGVTILSHGRFPLYLLTDISLPFFKYRRRKNVPAFEKAGTSRSADIEI